jgi:Zn-dependent protease
MPTKFDLGDESLSVTAKPEKDKQLTVIKDSRDADRIRQTIPSTLVSMGFTIWVYAVPLHFGWAVAVGLVLSIFIHECGHALAARRYGLPYMGMRFIPLIGGVVFHQKGNTTVTEDAFIGIMGPVFGTLVAVTSALIYHFTGNELWRGIAELNFFMNAANLLIPAPPLDGHWIAAVFSKKSRATRAEKIKWAFLWAALGLFLILGHSYVRDL